MGGVEAARGSARGPDAGKIFARLLRRELESGAFGNPGGSDNVTEPDEPVNPAWLAQQRRLGRDVSHLEPKPEPEKEERKSEAESARAIRDARRNWWAAVDTAIQIGLPFLPLPPDDHVPIAFLWIYQMWFELHAEREYMGMGSPRPITTRQMLDYFEFHQIRTMPERRVSAECCRAMDAVWFEWYAGEQKKARETAEDAAEAKARKAALDRRSA